MPNTGLFAASKTSFLDSPYELFSTDDVVLIMTAVNDEANIYLNKTRIAKKTNLDFVPLVLSFKDGLIVGQNILRIMVIDYSLAAQKYWSLSYTLGVYDANGAPKYPLIDLDYHVQRDGPPAVLYDVSYTLSRV